MKVFIHEIKLNGDNDFAKRFNSVSDAFSRAMKEDTKEAWDDYSSMKYCLEQGLPISTPNVQESDTNKEV